MDRSRTTRSSGRLRGALPDGYSKPLDSSDPTTQQEDFTATGKRNQHGRGTRRGLNITEPPNPLVPDFEGGSSVSDAGSTGSSASGSSDSERRYPRRSRAASINSLSACGGDDSDESDSDKSDTYGWKPSSRSSKKAVAKKPKKKGANTMPNRVATASTRTTTQPVLLLDNLPPLQVSSSQHHSLFLSMLQRQGAQIAVGTPDSSPAMDSNKDWPKETGRPITFREEAAEILCSLRNVNTNASHIEDSPINSSLGKRPRSPSPSGECLNKVTRRHSDQPIQHHPVHLAPAINSPVDVDGWVLLNPTETGLDIDLSLQEVEGAGYGGHMSDPPPLSDDPSDFSDEMQSDTLSDDEPTPKASRASLPLTMADGAHPPDSTQDSSPAQQNHKLIVSPISLGTCDDSRGVGSSTGQGHKLHSQHHNAHRDNTDIMSSIEEPYEFEGELISLLQYPHSALITRDVREHMDIITGDTERIWESTQPPMEEDTAVLDPQYNVEAFRTFPIPDILIALSTGKPSISGSHTRKSHSDAIYLTILTYMHLLGLRAVTFFRSGVWDIATRPQSSTCRLSNFILLYASTQHPHNQLAKQIFIANFIRSAHEGLYSAGFIGGRLMHEEGVGRAFDHAFNTQAEIQRRYTTGQDPAGVYKKEHSIAIKIGKWLMLHQAFWLDGNRTLGELVGKVGPGLCSSDESDDESSRFQAQRVSKRVPWRSAKFKGFIESLRRAGLYPPAPPEPDFPDGAASVLQPPEGIPLTWISALYTGSMLLD